MEPFDERVYLELTLSKSMEMDENGNPIIYAEASNEGLDQQEQIVLQRALLDSKDYFLKNGIISYDHKHLRRDPNDPEWNPEKYIIGEPMAVEKRGQKTFVKARLFQSSPIVQEIMSKLKDGARYIKTSVGGSRPVIINEYDKKLKRSVEKVVQVIWNELALTPRPVNDSLSPVALSSAAFVKSLSAGYSTDSAMATGGAALIPQDLEGDKKGAIHAVITAIAVGDVRTPEAGREVLAEHGISNLEADDILTEVVNRRNHLKEVFRMEANLSKSFEDAIADLEKALKPGAQAPAMAPAPAPAPAPMPHAEPDGDESGEYNDGDEDNEEGEGEMPAPPAPPMKKSSEIDDDVEFLDVSPILSSMAKSLKAIAADNAELRKSLASQDALVKSLANTQLQSAMVLKSLTDTPTMRKSVLNRQERFQGAGNTGAVEMTAGEILRKSTTALEQGKISLREATILEERVNKGMEIPAEMLSVLKSL